MKQILVAEDEPRIASFVARGLRVNGFEATVVEDGGSALAGALSGGFDLLLLDIGLPEMDGLTVLRHLHDADRPIPVIILSARNSESDRAEGLACGAKDYVTKPFSFGDLLARIRLQVDPAC